MPYVFSENQKKTTWKLTFAPIWPKTEIGKNTNFQMKGYTIDRFEINTKTLNIQKLHKF